MSHFPRWERRVLCAALAASIAACSVDAAGEGSAERDIARWEVQEDLSFGANSGTATGPSRVDAVAICERGSTAVLDGLESRILLYDSAGTLVRTVGRHGRGPGEFNWPGPMGCRGDTLWVGDGALNRLSLFDLEGEVLESFSLSSFGPEPVNGSPQAWTPEGRIIVVRSFEVTGDVPEMLHPYPILAVSRTDGVDTLLLLHRRVGARFIRRQPQGGIVVADPYQQEPIVAFGPRGDLVVVVDRAIAADARDTATFGVQVLSSTGEQLASRRFRYAPQAVSPTQRDSVHHGILHEQWVPTLFPSEESALAAIAEYVPTPAFWPPVREAKLGAGGSIWLRRTGDAWFVVDASLRPVATAVLPAQVRILGVGRRDVWGVTLDADDLPRLSRYRVVER